MPQKIAPLSFVLALVVPTVAAAPGATTPDGREIARIPSTTTTRPSGDAPYGDTPDWQNTLRIQVGGLAFGDLDGDGRDDLAVVTYHSNSFPPYDDWHDYVYFNRGGVLEDAPSWQSSDQHHSSEVAIADIDGDGHDDLVVARGGFSYDPNVVYFGSADGLATTPGWQSQQPAWAVGMALVDIDAATATSTSSPRTRATARPIRTGRCTCSATTATASPRRRTGNRPKPRCRTASPPATSTATACPNSPSRNG